MPATNYRVEIDTLDELTPRALHDLFKLRVDVFIVEQNCVYPEIDGKDVDALHLRLMDGDKLMAATRILKPASDDSPAKIGRVVVSPLYRGLRLGEAVMQESVAACHARFPGHAIGLSAQSHLRAFYASLGFLPVSEEYLEDGIPHIDMIRNT